MLGIVIVIYNSEAYIQDCLQSVFQDPLAPYPFDFAQGRQGGTVFLEKTGQVVVVDNNSKDSSLQIVRDNFPQVEVILNNTNLGFTKAVNQGIKFCLDQGYEYVLLLNPDTKVEPGALKEMIKVMEEGSELACRTGGEVKKQGSECSSYKSHLQIYEYNHPNSEETRNRKLETSKPVAIVQPLITLMSDPDKINTWGNEYKGFGLVTLGGYREKIQNSKFKIQNSRISYASGACMLIRASVFEEVGLFDESFFMYFEDTEFSQRVRQAGYEICLAAKARVQHDYHRPYSFKKFVWFCIGWGKYAWKSLKTSSKL